MTPSDIKACAAHKEKQMDEAKQELREIASLVEDAEKQILRNSTEWVPANLVDDPMEVVAAVLFIATFKSSDPAFIGQWIIDMAKQIIERSVEAGIDS